MHKLRFNCHSFIYLQDISAWKTIHNAMCEWLCILVVHFGSLETAVNSRYEQGLSLTSGNHRQDNGWDSSVPSAKITWRKGLFSSHRLSMLKTPHGVQLSVSHHTTSDAPADNLFKKKVVGDILLSLLSQAIQWQKEFTDGHWSRRTHI